MDFMTALTNNEKALTANGAAMYKTSTNALVDINFMVPELRVHSQNNSDIPYQKFMEAYNENANYALRWLLYLRDVRGGLGERASFRNILLNIGINNPSLLCQIIDNIAIAEYGRWDDLIALLNINNEKITEAVVKVLALQLSEDINNVQHDKPCSLLGKWMPSCNASSPKTKHLARMVCKKLKTSEKQYRKMLTLLRKQIKIVETDITNRTYENINYESVPSKANIKYRNAFLRNDTERRQTYLDSLSRGEVKINATTQYPHDIVHAYECYSYNKPQKDETLEAMWLNQKREATYTNTLIVRDGSGSMTCSIGRNTNVTALEVATALAILCSEQNEGAFKDKFITFSARPSIINLSACRNLRDKIYRCLREDDYSNTNLHATFDLILQTAIKHKMTQADLPERIVVISDMQFDGNSFNLNSTLMENIAEEFKEHGYLMPKLVFWNCSPYGNQGVPMQVNELGVILISGFSTELLKFITANEFNPAEALYKVLDNPRYDVVDSITQK